MLMLRQLLLLLLQLLVLRCQAAGKLQQVEIKHWVSKFELNFKQLLDQFGSKQFEQDFKNQGIAADYVDEAKAKMVLDRVKDRIQKFIGKNEMHVERIRKEAEDSFAGHTYRNYSCSQFTDHPYLRAAAIKKFVQPNAAKVAAAANETKQPPAVITIVPVADADTDKCSEEATLNLTSDPRLYGVETNRRVSTAHVPPNIYDASNEILNVANWSESLDSVFIENARDDSALKWQYFGSTEGMFKIYPGIQWYIQTRNYSQKDTPVDFFDCRTQYWYLLAAAYPKDMLVLIDNSGSMKGRRAIIANKTLTELLDTLTVNDYFNVIMFMNSSIKYLSPEFNRSMLQATENNKYRVMEIISEDEQQPSADRKFGPHGISDYEAALSEAFELLQLVRTNATWLSSNGTQAIMLITDGAPGTYESVFQKYNAEGQVRVFTYLIGQEAANEANVRQIACRNRGFFTQISTLADVKENVQRYIPVMARTNAMDTDHFFVWTGVHRNQIKTQNPQAATLQHTEGSQLSSEVTLMSVHDADAKSAAGAAASTPATAANATTTTTTEAPKGGGTKQEAKQVQQRIVIKTKLDSGPHIIQEEDPRVKNRLFSSVAQAAYDMRINETLKQGTGALVGVAGLDVPIDQFEQLGPSWELGAFAYIFMITNNGHVLFHPEHRLMDENGNLRKFFNNRDIAEIEYPSDAEPLFNSPNYSLPLRVRMIQREVGSDSMSRFKLLGDLNRVHKQKQKFLFAPIQSSLGNTPTPFSLALALPWKQGSQSPRPLKYKSRNLKFSSLGDYDIQRISSRLVGNDTCSEMSIDAYLVGLGDYEFCGFNDTLLALFRKNPICAFASVLRKSASAQNRMQCQSEFLLRALTDVYATQQSEGLWMKFDKDLRAKFGVSLLFLWTSNGLVRWYSTAKPLDPDFILRSRNASREALYERTVALNSFESGSHPVLVLSTPSSRQVLRAIKRNATFPRAFPVRATAPIRTFQTPTARAPIGIVGAELDYASLESIFFKVTNSCSRAGGGRGSGCLHCGSDRVRCYLIDTDAFVVVSEARADVGKPFDQVECAAMQVMIDNALFTKVSTFDYQAMCIRKTTITASAAALINPIKALARAAVWLMTESIFILMDLGSAAMRVMVAAAQEIAVAMQRMTQQECEQVENSRSERKQQLRDEIDSLVSVAKASTRKMQLQDKTDYLKRKLIQRYCTTQSSNEDACAYLCRLLQDTFRPGVVADLIGSCPKQRIKQEACVLRRELASWSGDKIWGSVSPLAVSCHRLSFCQTEACNGDMQDDAALHIRPVEGTNLLFLAMETAPNCKCRGCADIITTVELEPAVNYSESLPFRENPSWSMKTITLRDNDTECSKRASNKQPSLITTLLSQLLLLVLLLLLLQG